MRAKHSLGFLLLLVGAVFLHACESSVTNQEIGESFELITGLEQVSEASNVTATINRGENVGANSWFQVNLDNIQSNEFITNGIVEGWCLEWKKPLNADNDVHEGTKIFATNGNDTWKPLNYLFSIKKELEIEDPSLTRREFQAAVWTLAGDMGIAPKFDVTKLSVDELPNRLVSGNQPNFSRDKVVAIVSRVQSEYRSAKFRLIDPNLGGHVLQTDDDQQDVYIPPVEDPGKDVVVFNDVNLFTDIALENSNNVTLVENLVNFTTDGSRNSGETVWFDCGRSSAYNGCTASDIAEMRSTIESTMNLDFLYSSSGSLTSIPSEVKVLFLWLPRVAYTVAEINTMKEFAAEGGRIVFIGEHEAYYGATGIALENQFLINMGAVLRNTGSYYECLGDIQPGYQLLPSSSIFEHPITAGVTELLYACFSNIEPGPNDFVLMVGQDTELTMAGVAEIDPEPITELAKSLPMNFQARQKDMDNAKTYGWDN